jgi:hypothetical protein
VRRPGRAGPGYGRLTSEGSALVRRALAARR